MTFTLDDLKTGQGKDGKPFVQLPEGDYKATLIQYTEKPNNCLLYTSPSPRDRQKSRMPTSA